MEDDHPGAVFVGHVAGGERGNVVGGKIAALGHLTQPGDDLLVDLVGAELLGQVAGQLVDRRPVSYQ